MYVTKSCGVDKYIISASETPKLLSVLSGLTIIDFTVFSNNNYALFVSREIGLSIIDIIDLENPKIINSFEMSENFFKIKLFDNEKKCILLFDS